MIFVVFNPPLPTIDKHYYCTLQVACMMHIVRYFFFFTTTPPATKTQNWTGSKSATWCLLAHSRISLTHSPHTKRKNETETKKNKIPKFTARGTYQLTILLYCNYFTLCSVYVCMHEQHLLLLSWHANETRKHPAGQTVAPRTLTHMLGKNNKF